MHYHSPLPAKETEAQKREDNPPKFMQLLSGRAETET